MIQITIGSGNYTVSSNALDSNGNIAVNRHYSVYNRMVITYDDGNTLPKQAGELHLYYESGTIVIRLFDVQFDALPRTCNKNQGRGELFECGPNVCEDLVIDIRNKGTWTYFTCPHCLRNVACGITGKYYKGDCTKSQLRDPSDECSKIFVGADGVIYTDRYGRAWGDDAFGDMADTWIQSNVDSIVSTQSLNQFTPTWAKGKSTSFRHRKQFPIQEGRSLAVEDPSFYDGYCKNNMTHISIVNETCRQNTVVRYEKCCKEIGICTLLWFSCIEDYCSCTEPSPTRPANITDEWCLNEIILLSMNTTCSVDALYPTSTPTAAPTPSPTGLVAGLPQGQKAEDLIWLYLIFVVLFVIIAIAAYWYYRKKSGGKATFNPDNDDEDIQITSASANTYANTYAQN